MAKIYCTECGLTGDSKCPYCRNIYTERDSTVGMMDTIMSHRLKISNEGIFVKRYSLARNHSGPETNLDILVMLKDVLGRVNDAELKVLSCTHTWDFAPFSKSSIGCGHGCEEKPLLDYLSDAWYYLYDGVDAETSRYPHGDEHDKAAAAIIQDTINEIEGI